MTVHEHRDLGARLEPAYDEHQIADVWERIETARDPARRRSVRWAFACVTATAIAAMVVISAIDAPSSPQAPLMSRDPAIALTPGAVFEVAATPREVALDDGSRLDLAADTRLEVLANESDRFVTLLARGRASFDVRPGLRKWSIETTLATVEVVGTAFTLEHRADRLVVAVERGVVIVRGERVPNRIARLTAGQRIEVPRTITASFEEVAPTTSVTSARPADVPASPSRESSRRVSASHDDSTITGPAAAPRIAPATATRGDGTRHPEGAAPRTSIDRGPLAPIPTTSRGEAAEPRPVAPSFADVMADADRLRAAGDAASAAARLETAIAAHPDDPGVGVAAFMLGRIALDTLGQPHRAARAFAIVIASGSPHGLREDAHARRAEALFRAGDRAAATAAIDLYERTYPAGRHGPALRALLDQTRVPP